MEGVFGFWAVLGFELWALVWVWFGFGLVLVLVWLGLCWVCVGFVLGLYWVCVGFMLGYFRLCSGFERPALFSTDNPTAMTARPS